MAIKSLMIGVVLIFVLTIHVECIRKNNARLSGGVNSQRHSRPFQISNLAAPSYSVEKDNGGDLYNMHAGASSQSQNITQDMACAEVSNSTTTSMLIKKENVQQLHLFAGTSTQSQNIAQNLACAEVALILRVGSEGEAGFCGGALVHPQWVLTAAHCCFHDGELITHGQAVLGAHSLYDRFENGRRMINVEQTVIHPDYDALTFANDLALLKLANIAQTSDTIDTIRLPYLDTVTWSFTGTSATASGWGIAAEGVTFISPTLREKPMIVIADELCNTTFSDQLSDSTVCTYSSSGGGTCKGDNGGPLTLLFNRSEELILLGVASFVAASGCNSAMPSVFTRVQRYLPWISDITGIALD